MQNKQETIKFKIEHEYKPLVGIDMSQFRRYKPYLLKRELIGTLREGEFAGYDCGNLSVRLMDKERGLNILITGTQTSGKPNVRVDDLVLILKYNSDLFSIKSCGMAKPSSETPLHWSAYETDSNIKAIIHAHIFEYDFLYKHVLDFFEKKQLPLTKTPSKTREIGFEVRNLIKERGYQDVIGILNHEGGFGLLAMGESMADAYLKLIRFHKQLLKFWARSSSVRTLL